MRETILFLFLVLGSFNLVIAQTETEHINQFDELGKKHGLWIAFVDSNFQKVKKENADFWYYAEYFHGKKFIEIDRSFRTKKCTFYVEEITTSTDIPRLLNGKYVFTDHPHRKGFTITHEFGNGRLLHYRAEWDDSGHYYEDADYNKKYEGNEYSYYVTGQSYKKKIWKGYGYYDENGKYKVEGKKYEIAD